MLLFCLLLGCLNGSTFALLQNTALRRGQQLTLECKVEDGFLGWFHIQVGSNSEKPIFTSSTDLFNGRAKVNRKTNDSQVLTVDGMRLSDAGTYGCKTKSNSSTAIIIERAYAHVIVLDGNIRIFRQNSSHIQCEIDYNGIWRPELRFFATINAGAKDAGHSTDQPVSYDQSNGNRKKLVVLLETSSFADKHHNYSCQLSFANRSLQLEHLVTNVPVYKDSVVCGSNAVDDGCEGGSEQTTTAAAREQPSGGGDSSVASSSVVLAISLAVVCFFFIDLVVAVVFVSVRKRKRIKRRTSKDSKSSSNVTPGPDILDRSEENNSNGFARRLPEIPSETFTYAEVLHHDSVVDLSGVKGSRIVASDGTEYMLMNNSVSEGRRPPFRMLPPPSAVPSMLYASIDHLHAETPLNY